MANPNQARLTISNFSSTAQLIKQTTSTFASNFFSFFLLSLLHFTFRTYFENGTVNLINDDSFISVISRLDPIILRHNSTQPNSVAAAKENFTLSSIEAEINRYMLRTIELDLNKLSEQEHKMLREIYTQFYYIMKDLVLAFVLQLTSFIVVYSLVSGIVFVAVGNDLLGRRHGSFLGTIWSGSKTGIIRQVEYFAIRLGFRFMFSYCVIYRLFLRFTVVPRIDCLYSYAKVYIWLALIPGSIVFPWVMELEGYVPLFFYTWWVSDGILAQIMALGNWVCFVDRPTMKEIVKAGNALMSRMLQTTILIKSLEHLICEGPIVRKVLSLVFGEVLAAFFQSVFQVYFMVASLIVYFVARCKEADSDGGRTFGRNELENLIDDCK